MNNPELASPLLAFLNKYLFYVLLAVLVFNMLQRKHMKTGEKKRLATLYLAVAVLVLMGLAAGLSMVRAFPRAELLLIPGAAALGALVYVYRERVLPFRLRCRQCGARLDFERIAYHDSNLCAECDPPRPAEPPSGR